MESLEFEDDIPERYRTAPSLAKEHGIPVSTLYAATSTGRLISKNFNGRILIDAADAERYITLYKAYKLYANEK